MNTLPLRRPPAPSGANGPIRIPGRPGQLDRQLGVHSLLQAALLALHAALAACVLERRRQVTFVSLQPCWHRAMHCCCCVFGPRAHSPDSQLLDWARSFTEPASLELRGAQLEFEAYVPERRAFRLRAESGDVAITIKPGVTAVNPVFEIANAGPRLLAATLEGRALGSTDFAWDGSTFWLNKTVGKPAVLELRFGR